MQSKSLPSIIIIVIVDKKINCSSCIVFKHSTSSFAASLSLSISLSVSPSQCLSWSVCEWIGASSVRYFLHLSTNLWHTDMHAGRGITTVDSTHQNTHPSDVSISHSIQCNPNHCHPSSSSSTRRSTAAAASSSNTARARSLSVSLSLSLSPVSRGECVSVDRSIERTVSIEWLEPKTLTSLKRRAACKRKRCCAALHIDAEIHQLERCVESDEVELALSLAFWNEHLAPAHCRRALRVRCWSFERLA